MNKPVLVWLTGIPGTGKSTTAKQLQAKCEEAGQRLHFFNDYPYIIEWAKQYHGETADETKVTWFPQADGSENFNIAEGMYREMSAWVAKRIAHDIQQRLGEFDVFVVESARGAGLDGFRDRYKEELFEPMMKVLDGLVERVNVEMVVADIETVLDRMDERSKTNPEAAPSFVARKYVSDTDGIQSSFRAAQEIDGISINSVVDNSGTPEGTSFIVEGIAAQVLAMLGREGLLEEQTNPEGAHRHPESEN